MGHVAHRMVTKAGLRKAFGSWQQFTTDTIAANLKAHRVTSKMLRYRYALIIRLWHVVTSDLARQHRVCLRALVTMYRRQLVDSFHWWASTVQHSVKEARHHAG
jgi:hypothetical protein